MRARLWFMRFQVQRYQNPSLHPGSWGPPELRHGIVRWYRIDEGWLRSSAEPHPHQPFICTIGPGMSHVDECLCGSKRYGVFGTWSL